VADDRDPGRPPVEAVFVAWFATSIGATALVQLLARVLPPPSAAAPPAVALTLTVAGVSLAFAVAQAVLPGPRSSGCAGLAIPMLGAVLLAARGHEPAVVVSALFAGVFLTPAAYYIAIRLSVSLRGYARRRPLAAVTIGALGTFALVQALRLLIHLVAPSNS
jgi:hypothetical protein